MGKPILCLDFDGVIHQYDSKWTQADEIHDGPVDGAMEFISNAQRYFTIAIYSSRSHQHGGKEAMQDFVRDNMVDMYGAGEGEKILAEIQWPTEKPPAFLTLDDRVVCFEGSWPNLEVLAKFKPWNKRT